MKRRIARWITSIGTLTAVILAVQIAGVPVTRAAEVTPQDAPAIEEALQIPEDEHPADMLEEPIITDGMLGYNPIDEDFDAPVVDESVLPALHAGATPSYYGAKGDHNYTAGNNYSISLPSYIPALRNQNPYGSCWAHTSLALAEIYMMKKGMASPTPADYSELALAYFSYYTTYTDPLGGLNGDTNEGHYTAPGGDSANFLQLGGNISYSKSILAAWVGATPDTAAPYLTASTYLVGGGAKNAIDHGLDSSLAFNDIAHMTGYYEVNLNENRDLAKRLIQENGALGVSYFAETTSRPSYNDTYNSYCASTNRGTNHAVTIVGWDDDFPKDKFNNQPENNGAWLIRNSWLNGSDSAFDGYTYSYYGYFWMSYEEPSLTTTAHSFIFAPATNYDNNYQYDGSVGTIGYPYSTANSVSAANVFTAKACSDGEILKAVSFALESTSASYTVKIYLNPTNSSNPESGTLCETATTSGVTTFAGLYEVQLENPVNLSRGDVFAVVIELSSPTGVEVAKEATMGSSSSWIQTKATSSAGQSYFKDNGSWSDISRSGSGNLRIKAYTTNCVPATITNIAFTDATLTTGKYAKVGDKFNVGVALSPSTAPLSAVSWISSNPSVATVSAVGGNVEVISTGKTTITASANGISRSFDLYACNMAISGPDTAVVGTTESYSYTFDSGNSGYNPATTTWSSSDTNIATIDSSGRATFQTAGRVVLTVSRGKYTASKTVDVTLPSMSVRANVNDDYSVTITWNKIPGVAKYVARAYSYSTFSETVMQTSASSFSATDTVVSSLFANSSDTSKMIWYYVDVYLANGTLAKSESATVSISRHYPITYELNGGANPADAPQKYYYGISVVLPTPTKTGYEFDGWYENSDFSGAKLTRVSYGRTGPITVYAKWKINLAKPVVSYTTDTQGNVILKWNKVANASGYHVYSDAGTLLANIPASSTKSSYEYVDRSAATYFAQNPYDYYCFPAFKVAAYDEYQNDCNSEWVYATVYRYYRINYVTNGGSLPSGTENMGRAGSYVYPPTPTRSGYSFAGWYYDSACVSSPCNYYVYMESDVTIYAKWTKDGSSGGGTDPSPYPTPTPTPTPQPTPTPGGQDDPTSPFSDSFIPPMIEEQVVYPNSTVNPAVLNCKWYHQNGKSYWYENGVRQGTFDDPKGVIGDGTVRGREVCDMESAAWYWCDSVYNGAKAVNKEVWMPYIYQDEKTWSNYEIRQNAAASIDEHADMSAQLERDIKAHTGKWVRYNANGKMFKSWYKVTSTEAQYYPAQVGNIYYYDPKTGLMAKGYLVIDGVLYHFDEITGVLQR